MRLKNSTSDSSERLRVARDLHDTLAQELAALGYICDEAIALAPMGQSRDSIVDIRQRLSIVSATLRDEIGLLREHQLVVGQALALFLNQLQSQSAITVNNQIPTNFDLPQQRQLDLYRALREIVTNIFAHSAATILSLRSITGSESIEIEITDDGVEYLESGATTNYRFGSAGLRERIEAIGGQLSYLRNKSINCYRISIPQ